jgi:hypothetical protein
MCMLNEGNQIHNFISRSGTGTVINYGSGSDLLTCYGSGSTSQKVTVPTVPVPQRCLKVQQVDEGVVVEGQRFDDLVPYGVDVAEGLEVHVGELAHHCFDASFQGLFGEEGGFGFGITAG